MLDCGAETEPEYLKFGQFWQGIVSNLRAARRTCETLTLPSPHQMGKRGNQLSMHPAPDCGG